jgi:hypothetical protein
MSRSSIVRRAPFLALLILLVSSASHATVLTFDPVNMNFEHVSQDYGDRVTMTPQNGFEYGTDAGFTPNVEVDYGLLPTAIPALWTTGYGDLTNVLYEDQDGYGYLEITLTADPLWNVQLHGFDMAAYSNVNPINSVTVRDGVGTVLFNQNNVSITASGHDSFTFDPPLQAATIVIAIDTHNLGTVSDNISIDNITFGQLSVPLPVEASTWGSVKALFR